MSLAEDVDLEEYVMAKDDLSGADIKAVCTEAGLLALRERRMRVTKTDFTTAREKVKNELHLLTCYHLIAHTGYRYYIGRTRVHQRVYTCRCRIMFLVLFPTNVFYLSHDSSFTFICGEI
jgi:hypothetical protein